MTILIFWPKLIASTLFLTFFHFKCSQPNLTLTCTVIMILIFLFFRLNDQVLSKTIFKGIFVFIVMTIIGKLEVHLQDASAGARNSSSSTSLVTESCMDSKRKVMSFLGENNMRCFGFISKYHRKATFQFVELHLTSRNFRVWQSESFFTKL